MMRRGATVLELVIEAEEMRAQGGIQRAVGDLDRLDGLRLGRKRVPNDRARTAGSGWRRSAPARGRRRRCLAPARRRPARCGSLAGQAWRARARALRPARPPPAIATSKRSRLSCAGIDHCPAMPRSAPSVKLLKARLRSRKGRPMSRALEQLLSILDIETLEENLFRGLSPQAGWQRVFGGQVIGQALVAAHRTVNGRACAFAACLFPARRRPRGADHLRGRPHPRRRQLLDPPRGGHPARPGDLLHGRLVP